MSRSSAYYQPQRPSAEEIAIKHRIDEIYTAYPFYGSRKIEAQLRREGVVINRKTVQRHMREMGIAAISPGPNVSRRHQKEHVFPYLLRHLTIRMLKGWMYLVAILDWYSRYVGSPGTRSHARACLLSSRRFRGLSAERLLWFGRVIREVILRALSLSRCSKLIRCRSAWTAKDGR